MIPLSNRWTPYKLRRRPRLWVDSADARWNSSGQVQPFGSRGLDRSVVTPSSTSLGRGLSMGNLPTIKMDTTVDRLDVDLNAWGTSGQLTAYTFFHNTTVGSNGAFGKSWPDSTNAVALYFLGEGDIYAFGNGCCTAGTTNPSFRQTPSPVVDTGAVSFWWQLGATNLYRYNGVTSTPATANGTLAVPNYAADTWNLGTVDTTSGAEGMSADAACFMLFDYFLTTREFQLIEGYYHHRGRQQHRLPLTHPYRNSRP